MLILYKFYVGEKCMLRVNAENVTNALQCANVEAREQGHVTMGESFAWFERPEPNTFYLGHNVFLD